LGRDKSKGKSKVKGFNAKLQRPQSLAKKVKGEGLK
jgi:hypothetical protein